MDAGGVILDTSDMVMVTTVVDSVGGKGDKVGDVPVESFPTPEVALNTPRPEFTSTPPPQSQPSTQLVNLRHPDRGSLLSARLLDCWQLDADKNMILMTGK